MTKKRYRKLLQAYVSGFMAGHEGAGPMLNWVRSSGPGAGLLHHSSYGKAWEAMAPCAAKYIKVK